MISEKNRQSLKILAKASIKHGLEFGTPIKVDTETLDQQLTELRATFVTLEIDNELRGCIGMLEAIRPLAEDIANNSYAAAFSDSRFPPVGESELDKLSIHISILSPAEIIPCQSETELIQQIRPAIDGLILDDGIHRATLLPAVWETLTEPVDFIRRLKNKGGFPANQWSSELKAYRYTTESF